VKWGYKGWGGRGGSINSVSKYFLDGSVQKIVDMPSITPLHAAEQKEQLNQIKYKVNNTI